MTPVKGGREEPVERTLGQNRPKMEGAFQSLEKLKSAFEGQGSEHLLQSHHHFLINYKNPARADEIRELAKRVLSPQIASALNDYADQVQLPTELLRQIVIQVVENVHPDEAKALRQTSRQVRRFAVEAHREELSHLNIKTGDQAVAFVQELGAGLTYLNLEGLDLSETQLGILFQFLPKLQVLILTLGRNCARKIAEAQTLTQLHLILDENDIPILANSSALRNLESLKLRVRPHTIDFESSCASLIAGSQNFANLRSLDLSNQLVINAGAIAIAQSPSLTNLETLNLSQNLIRDEGAIAIARSTTLSKLKHLFLGDSIREEGTITIAQSQTLKNLRTLSLTGVVGDRGVAAIANSQTLTNLQNLYLAIVGRGQTNISVEGAKALAHSQTLTNLRSLSINESSLGDEGAKAIALSSTLGNLKILRINRCAIGNSGLVALANYRTFKLEELYCGMNHFDAEGLIDFAKSQQIQDLKVLNLRYNERCGPAIPAFADLKNLQILDLALCRVSDVGAIALAQSLRKIRFLDLSSNNIGDAGATALAKSPHLQNIQRLNLSRNQITVVGAIALSQSLHLQHLQICADAPSFTLDLSFNPCAASPFAMKQHNRIRSELYPSQKEALCKEVAALARLKGRGVEGPLEIWGREHLFEDPEILNQALMNIKTRILT